MNGEVPTVSLGSTTTDVLAAVHRLHGDGPLSVRAVADHCGLSKAAAHYHLSVLRSVGHVTWTLGRHGTLRPVAENGGSRALIDAAALEQARICAATVPEWHGGAASAAELAELVDAVVPRSPRRVRGAVT